jgi:hypothetical protein
MHDLDDLSNRLLRIVSATRHARADGPSDEAILIARNLGPADRSNITALKGVIPRGRVAHRARDDRRARDGLPMLGASRNDPPRDSARAILAARRSRASLSCGLPADRGVRAKRLR